MGKSHYFHFMDGKPTWVYSRLWWQLRSKQLISIITTNFPFLEHLSHSLRKVFSLSMMQMGSWRLECWNCHSSLVPEELPCICTTSLLTHVNPPPIRKQSPLHPCVAAVTDEAITAVPSEFLRTTAKCGVREKATARKSDFCSIPALQGKNSNVATATIYAPLSMCRAPGSAFPQVFTTWA